MVSLKGLKPKNIKKKTSLEAYEKRRKKEKKLRPEDWKITSVKRKLSQDPWRLPKAWDPRGV